MSNGLDYDLEPEEGDLVTSDHVHFYQDGKRALVIDGGNDASEASMWEQIDAYMARDQFWPNVWFISDHGNAHIMSRPKKSKKSKKLNRHRY